MNPKTSALATIGLILVLAAAALYNISTMQTLSSNQQRLGALAVTVAAIAALAYVQERVPVAAA